MDKVPTVESRYLVSNLGMPFRACRAAATLGLVAPALLGLFSLFVPAVAAQGHGDLLGVVSDERTGAVIGSAQVTIEGTGIGMETSGEGTFEFLSVPAGLISIRVQAPGYPTIVEDIELAPDVAHFVHIPLPTVGAFLEELLVVGRARRQDSAETAADLLEQQILGFSANQGNRGVGDSPIFLRGAATLNLSDEPTIFLDGVRLSGGVLEVLRQIPAVVVRSIRVERGPATTSVPLSATGVIHIETRSLRNDGR